MTALAHFMGLACIFKRHRCGNGRAELAGFNQGRYLDKLIGVRLNCYHRTPNAVALAGIFRRLTDGRNKPAAAFENFERSLLGVLANGIEELARERLRRVLFAPIVRTKTLKCRRDRGAYFICG